MRIKQKHRDVTLIYIPDASRPIRRTRFAHSTYMLLMTFTLITIISLILWQIIVHTNSAQKISRLSDQLQSKQKQYHQMLTDKDKTIEDLQTNVLSLSEQAEHIKLQLNEIKVLEKEIESLSNSDLQHKNIVQGLGGESIFATNEQIQDYVATTQLSLESLSIELNQISDHLLDAKSKIKENIKIARMTPSIWPASSQTISSGFGIRKDPFTQTARFHNGIDISGKLNDPIFAAADGLIISTGNDRQKGNYITIDHSNGFRTVYMHLNKINVNQGDSVNKGEQIGSMGSTGRSTGTHLHYEVLKNEKEVNPMLYIPE